MTDPTGVDVLARLVPTLALIVGALLALRWWVQRTRAGTGGGVRVVARSGLTRGAMVAVVAVGDRRFLVGAGEHGVSLISELDPTEAVAADALTSSTLPPGPRNGPGTERPWSGLLDRMRASTVRTHVERSLHAGRG